MATVKIAAVRRCTQTSISLLSISLKQLLCFPIDQQSAAHHDALAGLQALQHSHAAAAPVAAVDFPRTKASALLLDVDAALAAFLEYHLGHGHPPLAAAALA